MERKDVFFLHRSEMAVIHRYLKKQSDLREALTAAGLTQAPDFTGRPSLTNLLQLLKNQLEKEA